MNIGKQIDSLLKRHSSVYVKGLGAFSRVHTPATFDSKRSVFLPPISFVEFDHFKIEGYDFLTYLQQVEQLNHAEAEAKLDAILKSVFDNISQNGECILDSLGSLVSYGNSFVFKPLDLSGFLYAEVENEFHNETQQIEEPVSNIIPENSVAKQFVEEDVKPVHETPISVETAQQEASNAITGDSSSQVTEEADKVNSEEVIAEPKESNSYIYGLIAAIAILVLGGIYYYATMKPKRTLLENKITVEVPLIDSNLLKVDTNNYGLDDTTVVDISKQDSVAESTVVQQKEPEVIIDHKYAIVIGTHKSLAQAYDEADAYNKKGYKSVRVLQPNLSKNLKRVIWDTYPTREKRDSAMREVQKHHKKDAWGTEIN